jgi:hypothetical protein
VRRAAPRARSPARRAAREVLLAASRRRSSARPSAGAAGRRRGVEQEQPPASRTHRRWAGCGTRALRRGVERLGPLPFEPARARRAPERWRPRRSPSAWMAAGWRRVRGSLGRAARVQRKAAPSGARLQSGRRRSGERSRESRQRPVSALAPTPA